MRIFGLDKLSLVDYSNYACAVIFTGGCNFKCPFCHNRGLVEREYSPIHQEDVLEFLNKRFGLIYAVCVSGGEPTLERGLLDFLQEIKDIGYKVKLDTNGTNPEILQEVIDRKLVDYVAMDIKNCFDKYPITTGVKTVDINSIRKSINILMSSGIDYEFRTTLVAEFHDVDAIRIMSKELTGAKRIYLQQFVENENCIESGLSPVAKEVAEQWKSILEDTIQEVHLRGYV